jgi:ABC-type sugar transport system ATPase subunit
MNFFDGRIQIEGSQSSFVMKSGKVLLPEKLNQFITGKNGQELVLGIRPESISIKPYDGLIENTIGATVTVVEPLGDRTDVYFRNDSNPRFIANLEPHTNIKPEEQVKLHFNLNKAHLFEPGEAGRNIGL